MQVSFTGFSSTALLIMLLLVVLSQGLQQFLQRTKGR